MVTNATLMDNHQTELAEELATRGHCRWCVPEGVLDAIEGLEGMERVSFTASTRGRARFPSAWRRIILIGACVCARARVLEKCRLVSVRIR